MEKRDPLFRLSEVLGVLRETSFITRAAREEFELHLLRWADQPNRDHLGDFDFADALVRRQQRVIEKLSAEVNALSTERDKLAVERDLAQAVRGSGAATDDLLSIALHDIRAEIVRAREKHPSNAHKLAALVEEVGELAKALLEREPRERVVAEAVQVACVAVRIATEGDSDFPESVP